MRRRMAFRTCAGVLVGGALVGGALLASGPGLSGSRASDGPKPEGKGAARPVNRLAKETSPYLLLHAHNPVDWYPWGPDAFARAKAEDRPIFLSIGYSSCYWCHVMERESFESEAIARLMNERFVCVKVDREERPDVDQIYMAALQSFGNGGGWPMSMFLTPDGRPFFGGTYFPPDDRGGLEAFPTILNRVADAWRDHRAELEKDADRLSEVVRRATGARAGRRAPLSRALAAGGQAQLAEQFDPDHGGFGYDPDRPRRPKFPEPSNLVFLLDQHRRASSEDRPAEAAGGRTPLAMVVKTMDHLARGGIRDHLAGGYHRYSTERSWTVPHFEKMLYDNAQLATAHLLAFEATGDPRWRREAEATFAFIERSMTTPGGAFTSALDAETDGEEGLYYVWTRGEVRQTIGRGDDYTAFARVYGLDRPPNFEVARFILFEPLPRREQAEALGTTAEALESRLVPLREKLLAVRDRRPAPLLDDKVLTSWNGLMIAAYADGFRVLKDDRYRQAAEKAADFLLATLRAPDGRLLRTYRSGRAKLPAYLEDYAFLAHGLLRLQAATGDPRRLVQARELTDRMIDDFADAEDGGFFFTADDHESLLARPKDPYDNALPSGNSVAIRNLIALGAATGEPRYLDLAGRALDAFSPALAETPVGLPLMLVALGEYLDARPGARPDPRGTTPVDAKGGPEQVVDAKASLDPSATVAPGREFAVTLTLTVRDGWHIYANPVRSEVLKPTTVALPPDQVGELARVDYPPGQAELLTPGGPDKVAVYQGRVTLTARVRLRQDAKPGPASLAFKVQYQACDDRACLAPASLTVPVSLTIGPR